MSGYKRIIGVILVKDGWAVQSYSFQRYRPLGRPEILIGALDRYGVDEIVLLDISATRQGTLIHPETVAKASRACRVPLAVGGGISSLRDVKVLLDSGADKIVLNNFARIRPKLVSEIAAEFGNQCVIVSIDAVASKNGPVVYDYAKNTDAGIPFEKFLLASVDAGAGEIFLNAPHRDGTREGFDTTLIAQAIAVCNIPVIACGGAGNADHFAELFQQTSCNAACAGNYFSHIEHSVSLVKEALHRKGFPVRLETGEWYGDAPFDAQGRLEKRPDAVLEELLFRRIEPEVI